MPRYAAVVDPRTGQWQPSDSDGQQLSAAWTASLGGFDKSKDDSRRFVRLGLLLGQDLGMKSEKKCIEMRNEEGGYNCHQALLQ